MLTGRVRPSFLLGVELPPVPTDVGSAHDVGTVRSGTGPGDAATPAPLGPWWEAGRVAADAGAGVVWFRGAIGAGASCDACTIAAAAIDRVLGVHLGVVSPVPLGRHPAVLAREVTALDVVSQGRAAVLLQWASTGRPSGLVEATEQLAEAVAVCGAVLRDESPLFEGRHYHVAGAVNRPRPVQSGGPPVCFDGPAGPAALVAARDPAGIGALRLILGVASAVVCSDDPSDVVAWRNAIEEASALARGTSGEPVPPALVCRTTMHGPTAWAWEHGVTATGVGERLRAARDAGADGVIVRVPPSRRADVVHAVTSSGAVLGPPAPSDLGPALAARFEPWAR